jgi:hypothetical protein
VKERIDFKIALLTFKAINHCAPSYLKDLICLKDPNASHSLRINLEPNILKPITSTSFQIDWKCILYQSTSDMELTSIIFVQWAMPPQI